jgi:5-methylcytosine-specific restriction endonuclease McrA
MKRVNHQRAARKYKEDFGENYSDFIRDLQCCICQRPSVPEERSTASHVVKRSGGGKKDKLVPMCGKCHDIYEEDQRSAWNRRYELHALAAALYEFYITHVGKP